MGFAIWNWMRSNFKTNSNPQFNINCEFHPHCGRRRYEQDQQQRERDRLARLQRQYRDRLLQRRQLKDAQAEIGSKKQELTRLTWYKVRVAV
jgi:hypothetical protein